MCPGCQVGWIFCRTTFQLLFGALGWSGSLLVVAEAARGTNGFPAARSIPKACGWWTLEEISLLGWRCGRSCSLVPSSPSSSIQGSPVPCLAQCCSTFLKDKIVRFPFSFAPMEGALKGTLNVFAKSRKWMQKEKVGVVRTRALKFGSVCFMDDYAMCSLAWTYQIFGFPSSYPGERAALVQLLQLQWTGRMTLTVIPAWLQRWEQTVLFRFALCWISNTSLWCFMRRPFQKCFRRLG